MQEYASRSEARNKRLHAAANKGLMFVENILLYSSEVKKCKKQGFTVSHESARPNNLMNSKIDWSNAFNNGIPFSVHSYIVGAVSEFPEDDVETLAQELYVVAARVQKNKN